MLLVHLNLLCIGQKQFPVYVERLACDRNMLTPVLPSGFSEAFATPPTWSYTFFAPSNTAFNNTGEYYSTFLATPKGKWWFGNLLQHHYVPNSQLKSTSFNATVQRFQTGSYLYVSGQIIGSQVILNNASTITSANLPVTSV